jgi:hypothetical protein
MGLRSQGHVVTLEITSGQVYRGKLLEGMSLPQYPRPQSSAEEYPEIH